MYAVTFEEVVQDASVIIGTLLIHFAPAIALFDFSSIHTLIANTFIDRVGVSIEDLGYDLVVLTPGGGVLTTGVCVRGVVLVIQ